MASTKQTAAASPDKYIPDEGTKESSTGAKRKRDDGEAKATKHNDDEASDGDGDGAADASDRDGDNNDDDEQSTNSKEEPIDKEARPSSIILRTAGASFVDFPVSNLRDHLICSLCKGYFRDPYTVADCLHSFCRSCLIAQFTVGRHRCPTCDISLEPDPFREVLADRTLQEVVEKVFPWMQTKEEQDEKEFYASRGIKLKPEYVVESSRSPDEKGWGGGEAAPDGKSSQTVVPTQESMSDMLDLQLEPDESAPDAQSMPPLRNPTLRTSGRLKIVSVKKYLLQRLGLKNAKTSIEVLCNGDPMGNELSLIFILRTRWLSPNNVLTLKYRLMEEHANTRGNLSAEEKVLPYKTLD
eukprot:g126.t1 g126   contig1:300827-302255(-)